MELVYLPNKNSPLTFRCDPEALKSIRTHSQRAVTSGRLQWKIAIVNVRSYWYPHMLKNILPYKD